MKYHLRPNQLNLYGGGKGERKVRGRAESWGARIKPLGARAILIVPDHRECHRYRYRKFILRRICKTWHNISPVGILLRQTMVDSIKSQISIQKYTAEISQMMDDGWVSVLRPFNSISVISRRWKGEHERLCAMKRRLGSGRISPPAYHRWACTYYTNYHT